MKTEETKDQVVETQAAAAPAQESGATELTLADLNAMKAIIDVAAQRGAFKAQEMEVVGKTFNKLNSFLEAATKPAEPQE